MNEEKTIRNLGVVKGKLLFFGGAYSNLQSLEALQSWAEANGYTAKHIFCTGDILGYCAQPVECIQLIKEWGIHAIAGNVEMQIRNNENNCGCDFKNGGRCDVFSRSWYTYIKAHINEEIVAWLNTLPHHIQFAYGDKKLMIVHGSWYHIADYIFKSTPWQQKQLNFDATGADIIIAGHCGLPFEDNMNDKLWLNAGVIGMPANDGTDRAWFLTLEPDKHSNINHRFHYYNYDNHQTTKLIHIHGLPSCYSDTLLTGIWDNCEILPEEEAKQQGKRIYL